MRKQYFENDRRLQWLFGLIYDRDSDLDFVSLDPVLKFLLDGRLENNVKFFAMALGCCLVYERMDILRYIHEKIRRIDTPMSRILIQLAEESNIPGVPNLQRILSNLS